MNKFSLRLKELRHSKNLSQQKLADLLEISKSSINMYERGEREPGLEMLETMADFFNVDIDYLLGKSNVANRALFNAEQYQSQQTIKDYSEITKLYSKLDAEDKAEIRGEIKQMLKADKYTASDAEPTKLVRDIIQSAVKDSMQIQNNVNR